MKKRKKKKYADHLKEAELAQEEINRLMNQRIDNIRLMQPNNPKWKLKGAGR